MSGKTKRTITEIQKLFTERNYILLSKEYINNAQKLEYICLKHNDITQSICLNNFLRNAGCKYCGIENAAEKHKKYNIDIIKDLFEKEGYTLLSDKYINIHLPLEYICNKHPDTIQTVIFSNFLSNNRCSFCSQEKLKHSYDFIKNEFSKRNYNLLTQEYKNSHQYLEYICNKHKYIGVQKITYNKLQQGRGCKECNSSKGEMKITNYLNENKIDFIKEFSFNDLVSKSNNLLRFDFAIFKSKKLLTLIEYDGELHYKKYFKEQKFETIKHHDILKNNYCEKNNIKLLRIPYWEFDNIENILDKKLKEEY